MRALFRAAVAVAMLSSLAFAAPDAGAALEQSGTITFVGNLYADSSVYRGGSPIYKFGNDVCLWSASDGSDPTICSLAGDGQLFQIGCTVGTTTGTVWVGDGDRTLYGSFSGVVAGAPALVTGTATLTPPATKVTLDGAFVLTPLEPPHAGCSTEYLITGTFTYGTP